MPPCVDRARGHCNAMTPARTDALDLLALKRLDGCGNEAGLRITVTELSKRVVTP